MMALPSRHLGVQRLEMQSSAADWRQIRDHGTKAMKNKDAAHLQLKFPAVATFFLVVFIVIVLDIPSWFIQRSAGILIGAMTQCSIS